MSHIYGASVLVHLKAGFIFTNMAMTLAAFENNTKILALVFIRKKNQEGGEYLKKVSAIFEIFLGKTLTLLYLIKYLIIFNQMTVAEVHSTQKNIF